MDIVKLKARTRSGSGKSYARKARVAGWIPAVYYGHGEESQKIEVDSHDFAALDRKNMLTHIIDLGLSDNGESMAIVKDIQRHILKDGVYIHVDFQHADMNEKIMVKCPVHITGEAVGVKDDHGILGHNVQEVSILCFPGDIPESINIDVSGLKIGDAIHVSDVNIPGIEIQDSPETVLANVSQPTKSRVDNSKTEESEEGSKESAE